MKKLLFFLCIFANSIYAYPPQLNITIPEIITKNTSIVKNDETNAQKPIHTIQVQVNKGTPLEGWRLNINMEEKISYDLGTIRDKEFPLYWRLAGSKNGFNRVSSTKALIAESIAGLDEIYKIEIAFDSSWDLTPGEYLANLHFTLESIM